jgi:hypothetical protein
MKILAALAIPVLLWGPARSAGAEWIAEAEAGPVYESNLSHGQLERDIKSDAALVLSASAGRHIALGDYSGLSVTGDAKVGAYNRYGGLNHLDLGVGLAFRSKVGLGATAPWWRATGTAARLNYQNDVRDGWLYTVGLGAGKRVGEKWDLRGDYRYDKRTADQSTGAVPGLSGGVFDQKGHSVLVNADYAYSESISVSAGYTRRVGDVVATTQRNFTIFSASMAIAPDPVFGSDTFAYKLRATVHVLFLGVSRALNGRSSLNFGFERQISHGAGNNNYYDNVGRITFAHSF